MFIRVVLFALVFFLAGCTSDPELKLSLALSKIIQAPKNFDPSLISNNWIINSNNTPRDWAIIGAPYDPKIRLSSNKKSFKLLKKVNSNILVTPFLTWSWKIERTKLTQHPIQIIVGLKSSQLESKSPFNNLDRNSITGLPSHDRQIIFVWGSSALVPKSIIRPPPTSNTVKQAVYVIRSGKTGSNEWNTEAVDLERISYLVWPLLNNKRAKVVFFGVSVAGSEKIEVGYVKNLRLSH